MHNIYNFSVILDFSEIYIIMKQSLLYALLATPIRTFSQSSSIPPPGQPVHQGSPGTFEIIGNSLVSAQQVSSETFASSLFYYISFYRSSLERLTKSI